MTIDQEDFEAWKANPITQALMQCCGVLAEEAKARWISASWDGGSNETTFLAQLRGQAEAFRVIQALTVEQIEETLSDEASKA